MFTIKYRFYTLAQPVAGETANFYDECESCHGPFEVISQGRENGYITVSGIPTPGNLPMTFGPFVPPLDAPDPSRHPRPTIWVMNEGGATIARYDL